MAAIGDFLMTPENPLQELLERLKRVSDELKNAQLALSEMKERLNALRSPPSEGQSPKAERPSQE